MQRWVMHRTRCFQGLFTIDVSVFSLQLPAVMCHMSHRFMHIPFCVSEKTLVLVTLQVRHPVIRFGR